MGTEQSVPEYAIENGWLVEVVGEHTCGTARNGHYGAHEPGCGMVPLATIEDLLDGASARAWAITVAAQAAQISYSTATSYRDALDALMGAGGYVKATR